MTQRPTLLTTPDRTIDSDKHHTENTTHPHDVAVV